MKIRFWVAAVAFFAVACGAVGAHAQTLSLAYHQGDTYKYALHLTTKGNTGAGALSSPIDVDMSATEAVSVLSVDASGDAAISIASSNLSVKSSFGGITNTTTGLPGQTVQMTIAPDGRILSVDGQALGGGGLPLLGGSSGSFISAILPGGAVKPGDTWTKSYDVANPAGTGTVHITADSKYLRDETIKSVNAAVVETRSTATFDLTIDLGKMLSGASGGLGDVTGMTGGPAPPASDSGPQSITITGTATSDTTTWIDPGSHRVVKTHETGSTDTTVTIPMPAGAAATSPTPKPIGPITLSGSETLDLTPA